MSGLEAAVEEYLGKQVRARGGWSLKFAPIKAGNPDRLILLPGHPLYLVETKAPRGALRDAQRVWHARAKLRGHTVYVLWSIPMVDEWLKQIDLTSC